MTKALSDPRYAEDGIMEDAPISLPGSPVSSSPCSKRLTRWSTGTQDTQSCKQALEPRPLAAASLTSAVKPLFATTHA